MIRQFQCISEAAPGPKWRELFQRRWPAYRQWFMKQGDHARPRFLSCERAMRHHMPELLPTYERLVELAGGGDQIARFLSLYQPTPYICGCSQAVWTRSSPFLIRNYDFPPDLWESVLLHTRWNGRQVIAMNDCLWGVLDGMNDDGLAVSLAFGGRAVVGDGFGVAVILRYVLEFCETVADAADVLCRIPCHMAYNVTLLDRIGAHATVYISPDRDPEVLPRALATNHQRAVDWPEHAQATGSVDRERLMALRLHDPVETRERFIERFLEPPLYQPGHEQQWSTLYTAIYRPTAGSVAYCWPNRVTEQSFDNFLEQTIELS